jgi:signal-transduction protein with cAMP-binding, CBS, and nucleotidyltransferase domain
MSVIQASFEPSVARETIDAGDRVADALDVMARTGQAVLIVTCEGLPIGIVTARDLCSESGRVACRESRVEDVLTWELVQIDSSADVLATLNTYTDAAWASLYRRGPCDEEAMNRRAAAWLPPESSS